MLLRDAVPGAPLDASPLARFQPGALPVPAAVVAPAAVVQGVVYIPVPGRQGLPGSVAGTLPYTSITNAPSLSYLYQQSQPAALWDITHNLGYYPAVTVMDSAGSVVLGDTQHVSATRLTLTFSAAFSGQASLT